MRLTIGTTMPYGEVDSEGRHMADAMEIVHTIAIGDVRLTTEQIHNRRVDLIQFLLRGHGHTTNSLIGILLVEKSAVTDHQQADTGIGAVEERLQTSTRHTSHTDILRIDLVIIRRVLVGILGNDPIDGLYLLLRSRHRTTIGFLFHGNKAGSQDDKSVAGNLVQELVVLPGRVGAGTVTPYQHGQFLVFAKDGEILRYQDGVLLQTGIFLHDGLVRTGTTIFYDT